MHPLIITVAGIGAELTKKETPYLPDTPDKIVKEAITISKTGAHVFHLHVRDEKGQPTCNQDIIKSIVQKIRQQTDLIIQISTGASVGDTEDDRLSTLDADVDMGSLTLGSINFGHDVFLNPIPLIEKLALKMLEKGIKPEFEIFDVSMMEQALVLIKKGLIAPPFHFNMILGGAGWLKATPENLDFLLKKLPPHSSWSASGVGKSQLPMIEYAIIHGGHIRTGLEDNIYLKKGILAKGNTELVEQVLDLAAKHERKIATMEEAREILGIR